MVVDKLSIRILDIVILLNCNLACDGCNNFSDKKISKILSYEEIEKSLNNWKIKLNPARVQIMGGEALLHKDLGKIIIKARETFPNADLRLFTNGLLLKKHKNLFSILKNTNCMLVVSIHSLEKNYLNLLYNNITEFLQPYTTKKLSKKSIVSFGTLYEANSLILEFRDMSKKWYKTYKNDYMPYNEGAPEESWKNCAFKYCTQLYDNKLWKCSQIAYLDLFLKKLNIQKEEWNIYLNNYFPLLHNDSNYKFQLFKENLEKNEFICNMCPKSISYIANKDVW